MSVHLANQIVTFHNRARVSRAPADGETIVQTPIRVINLNDLLSSSDPGRARYDVEIGNEADVFEINGAEVTIVQIPILILNAVRPEALNLRKIQLLNRSNVGSVQGRNNIVVQLPLFIILNPLLETAAFSTERSIGNFVGSRFMAGENNVVIQVPIQFFPQE